MANPNPPMANRWKPGQSGNPGGKPKAKITIDSIRRIIEKLSFLSREELQKIVSDPQTPMIELQFASIMAQAAKTGDFSRLNFLMERMVGKVANVNVSATTGLEDLSDKELIEHAEQEIARLKGVG